MENIKNVGAKGNGVSDDTAAIQAFLNSIGSTGGECEFPAGTYLISGTLNVILPPAFRCVIAGNGKSSSQIVWAAGFAGPTFSVPNGALSLRDIGVPDYSDFSILTAPGIPSSTTQFFNPFPFTVAVYVSAGTVTAIAINGTTTGLTSGLFMLLAGDGITLTYSVAPTWVWKGMA